MNDWAEFRHFRYLLTILEKQGFRTAAEELHTSQPNLTVQARQFQENAGARLFRRSRSGRIRPTETGVAFIHLARALLELRDEVIDLLNAIEQGEIESVCFGSTPMVDPSLFRSLCSMHRTLLPSASIRPTHGDTVQLVDEVLTGAVDAALSDLLTLDVDSVLCSEWRPKSDAAVRREIDAQEKFISFFKVGVLTRVMSGHDTASLETTAGARAADSSVNDLSDVVRSLDQKAQGQYSLRLLLAANGAEQLRDATPSVHRIFVDARAQVIEETLGNLSAFYAMFPGNWKFNVFPLWLSEEHHARLSSVFSPNLGHPHSDDLDAEYLNVFETRTRTPFFQDAYVDGVRVMLILGPTETGKSVHGNQIVAHEQKYGGFTYLFDIGGSYESVVELYGGRVDRIGKDGPRVNPFALEPTENNLKFLYSFIKLLLANGGAELAPEDDDVIHKAVRDMYLLDRGNRRLSNLFLPKKLDRCLSKWVRDGVYHAIFDNVEDSLSLSRISAPRATWPS